MIRRSVPHRRETKTVVIDEGGRLVRVEDRAAAASSPGCVFVLALVVGAVAYFYFDARWWIALLLAIATLLLPLIAALVFVPALLALGFLVGAVPFYVRRSRRNEQARALVKSIAAGTKRKHVLVYLRQFEPHRGWTFGLVRTPADGSSVFDADAARFNLESWVDSLGTAQVEVLKVSDRIDAAGGGIRLKDDEWKVHVLALIRAADSIVFLPGLSEGVLWEARQVREQGKLAATTVVMPFGITAARAEHDLWNSYRTDYAKLGYTLPPFDADGMLMKFSDDGSVSSAVPLIGTSYSELTEFVVSPAPAAERRT